MSDQPTDPWGNPIPAGERPPGPPGGDPAPPGVPTPPPGWWQASDGRWYPPETAPGGPTPPVQGPPPGGPTPPAGGDWWGAPPPGQPGDGWSPTGAPGVPTATGGWVPPPPGWGSPYVVQPKRDGQAVGSLVMGILALLCAGVIGIFLGTAAIVTGVLSRRRIRQSGGTLSGEGLATAGLVVGIIATAISVAFFVYTTFINPEFLQDVLDNLTTTTTTPG